MSYYTSILSAFSKLKKDDKNIVAVFIFGSFVTKKTMSKAFREVRVFSGKDFILSEFDLLDISPDIDILYVSQNIEKSADLFKNKFAGISGYYITVNFLSQEVFERELFSKDPTTIKRVLLYRRLFIIEGNEYISTVKKRSKGSENRLDYLFQKEFDARKMHLKLLVKNNVNHVIVTREEYKRRYPNFLDFVEGRLLAGFPDDRIKVVYPKSMRLKFLVNLQDFKLKEVI